MLAWVVNSRPHPRRSLLLRDGDRKPVTRRNFRPFLSYTCALFHFPYPVSPLLAALTQTAGCHPNNSHYGTPPSPGLEPHSLCATTYLFSFHILAHSFAQRRSRKPFPINRLRTLSRKHPGWGYSLTHRSRLPQPSPDGLLFMPPPPCIQGHESRVTSHQSQVTSHFVNGCRPSFRMLRFGVP